MKRLELNRVWRVSALLLTGLMYGGLSGWAPVDAAGFQESTPTKSGEDTGEDIGAEATTVDGQQVDEKILLDAEEQKALLLDLGKASRAATSAKDYTTVIRRCDETLKTHELLSANQKYVRSLIAWSVNRRGESRMELAFELAQVDNSDQAQLARDKAMADFERAIEENSQHWKPYLNRGILRAQNAQWDEAVADLKHSVKLRPTQTFAYFNLAEVECQRGNMQSAIEYYDHILKAAPDDRQALNGKALALAGLQRFDDSLTLLDELVEAHPEEAGFLVNRGDVLQARGDWGPAEKSYMEALKFEQSAAIYRRLAWLFATCPDETVRQLEGSLVLAKKSISLSRSASAAQWDTLAAAQAVNGKYREALDCLNKALELDPENDEYQARQQLYGSNRPFVQVPKVARQDTELLDR